MYVKRLPTNFIAAFFIWIIAGGALPQDGIFPNASRPLSLGANPEVTSIFQGYRLFARFLDVPLKDERVRLDNFAFQLRREPTGTTGLITVYGKTTAETRKRADRAKSYLASNRGIATSQIYVDYGVRPKLEFELWIVPPGAPKPVPSRVNVKPR